MYYLLALLLFIISYYVFVKLLSSIVKGCFMAILVLLVTVLAVVFFRSSKVPVEIFGLYRVDNFEVTKL